MNPRYGSSSAGSPPEKRDVNGPRVLLDTTVQLDRHKTRSRSEKLEGILAGFPWRFSTGISLVEFKATLIQECITIHNQLRQKGARFTQVRDALLEKKGQQISLRAHIFNNLLHVYGSSFDVTPEKDVLLAEKARLSLENIIPQLYDWFVRESVDAILNDRLRCDRSGERPRKKVAAFDTNLPDCKRGKNKSCNVEAVIRSHGLALMEGLRPHAEESEQLQRTIGVIQRVLDDSKAELSHGDCRRAGDCLIALEGQGKATHCLSSNRREWEPLSNLIGCEFVHVAYPEEKTT